MNVKREFKNQLELMEEPTYEMISEIIEDPSFSSAQIVDLFGMDFLKTAMEKLTEPELDIVQNFIDVFVNIVKD